MRKRSKLLNFRVNIVNGVVVAVATMNVTQTTRTDDTKSNGKTLIHYYYPPSSRPANQPARQTLIELHTFFSELICLLFRASDDFIVDGQLAGGFSYFTHFPHCCIYVKMTDRYRNNRRISLVSITE